MKSKLCKLPNCESRTHGRDCEYCLQHLPDELRCTHTTKKNKRCMLPAIPGSDVCKCHLYTMERGYGKGNYGFVYVYFTGFYNEEKGIYKIGRSTKPEIRLNELRSGNPFGKMLFSYFVGDKAKKIESELHKMYRQHWLEREMFILSDKDIIDIKTFLIRTS